MKKSFSKFLITIERSIHLVDAYLAANRGDLRFEVDSRQRAYECERRLAVLEIN